MPATLQNVRCLFADIDDTISMDGKITRQAYDALWREHDAGKRLRCHDHALQGGLWSRHGVEDRALHDLGLHFYYHGSVSLHLEDEAACVNGAAL